MTDSEAHLDVVDRALGDGHPEIRVCLDLDVSWRPLGRRPMVHIGTRRSPLHTPEQAADFGQAIMRRTGFRLAGVMGYGLSLTGVEGAGEVQTPVRGTAAGHLQPGDRVLAAPRQGRRTRRALRCVPRDP